MKAREKIHPETMIYTSKFNIHALGECICFWPEGNADSMYFKDLDVFIEATNESDDVIGWKDMQEAFEDKDIIVDNFNTCFFEPANEEDRERGFML